MHIIKVFGMGNVLPTVEFNLFLLDVNAILKEDEVRM